MGFVLTVVAVFLFLLASVGVDPFDDVALLPLGLAAYALGRIVP